MIRWMLDAPASWALIGVAAAGWASATLPVLLGVLLVLAGVLAAVLHRALAAAKVRHTRADAAHAAAEAASQAKSQFLANMSHEIRTPLTAILGHAELLQGDDQSPAERRESLASIRRSGTHLLEVVGDILDLSKIESGAMSVASEPCPVAAIVSEVASSLRVRAHQKGLVLALRYLFPVPETIRSDRLRIRQVLLNLVGNAIKFTDHGRIEIRVRFDPPGQTLAIDVADTGVGIPQGQLDLAFEPFTQLDGSPTRRHGGTGLGLTISRRIARLLGGDVVATSEEAKGSVFTLVLPTGSLEGIRIIHQADQADHLPDGPEPTHAEVRIGGRILLAEDGPDNQRLISFILRKAGADVVLAGDGEEGVHAAIAARKEGRPFDLILMDMQMPVMDGATAVGELRRRGFATPIVALTAHAMAGDRERCLAAGCDDYASKPIERAELLAICARWAEAGRRAVA